VLLFRFWAVPPRLSQTCPGSQTEKTEHGVQPKQLVLIEYGKHVRFSRHVSWALVQRTSDEQRDMSNATYTEADLCPKPEVNRSLTMYR
jgi:hypothetical protein